ncbi:MAG: ABC transporter ATP-binding protein [Elainellaceae cyanobacterium]
MTSAEDRHLKRQPFSNFPESEIPVLQVSQVTRQYANAAPAVCSVSLQLNRGELLGLLGPSGCGKTTLLRLIAGFERPQSGSIYLSGQPVAGPEWLAPEKRGIGMVFQDYALFPHLTVAKNVAFGLLSGRRFQRGKRRRVAEVLELVGLQGLEARYPHQLSGGQQQRVSLARALAPYPPIVLLDEPLSNLDAKVRLQLRQDLRDIFKAAAVSGIFVTHDQEEALSVCDRVAVMHHGRLVQVGTPQEIYNRPASRFVAEFVTQANFLPARHHPQLGWVTELGSFPSPQVLSEPGEAHVNVKHDALDAEIMIRQDGISLLPAIDADILIRDRQFLGRENRYRLRLPSGREVVARLSANQQFSTGDRVKVAVAEDAVSLCASTTALPPATSPRALSKNVTAPE